MDTLHAIVIDNLKENETVSYPVIILKGHIKNLPNSRCQPEPHLISVNNINSAVINDKFKVLYELEAGQNTIQLKYCCSQIEFRLNYISRQNCHSVLPLYIICDGHDGKFQAPPNSPNSIESACNRITLCSKLLQCVIGEKLHEENLGRKAFHLENTCQVFSSKLSCTEARGMSQEQLWNHLGREIANSELGQASRKFLGFLSCTRYCGEKYDENTVRTHEDLIKLTEAYVALGGGGLALFGSHCLFSWPEDVSSVIQCFENATEIDKNQLLDDSCYRNTFGACFSTTLGSVLHELCHTFDLGHTQRGIMGRGFDNIDKVFTISAGEEKAGSEIAKSFQNTIEFKEEFESERLSERLQEKKKEFNVKKHGKDEEDLTFWTRSCSVFLAYHKWFNDFQSEKILKFDAATKLISSTAGLRVVELRNEPDEMVVEFWIFDGRVLKYSFQIPDEIHYRSVVLVVEDNVGNVLKENITL